MAGVCPAADPSSSLGLKKVLAVCIRVAPVLSVHVARQIRRTAAEHPFARLGQDGVDAAFL